MNMLVNSEMCKNFEKYDTNKLLRSSGTQNRSKSLILSKPHRRK